jgi:hypothetical protein
MNPGTFVHYTIDRRSTQTSGGNDVIDTYGSHRIFRQHYLIDSTSQKCSCKSAFMSDYEGYAQKCPIHPLIAESKSLRSFGVMLM